MKRRTTILLTAAFIGATVIACLAGGDGREPECDQNAATFIGCITGPAIHVAHEGGCLPCDFNSDWHVDLRDWAILSNGWEGR